MKRSKKEDQNIPQDTIPQDTPATAEVPNPETKGKDLSKWKATATPILEKILKGELDTKDFKSLSNEERWVVKNYTRTLAGVIFLSEHGNNFVIKGGKDTEHLIPLAVQAREKALSTHSSYVKRAEEFILHNVERFTAYIKQLPKLPRTKDGAIDETVVPLNPQERSVVSYAMASKEVSSGERTTKILIGVSSQISKKLEEISGQNPAVKNLLDEIKKLRERADILIQKATNIDNIYSKMETMRRVLQGIEVSPDALKELRYERNLSPEEKKKAQLLGQSEKPIYFLQKDRTSGRYELTEAGLDFLKRNIAFGNRDTRTKAEEVAKMALQNREFKDLLSSAARLRAGASAGSREDLKEPVIE